MLALVHATYPATAVKKMIDVYTSPELPQRRHAKEVGSFVYNDMQGYHTLILLDVEDGKIADWTRNQAERDVFMGSRIETLRWETHLGQSITDAIALGAKLLPR